jgi:hypothetical protein
LIGNFEIYWSGGDENSENSFSLCQSQNKVPSFQGATVLTFLGKQTGQDPPSRLA